MLSKTEFAISSNTTFSSSRGKQFDIQFRGWEIVELATPDESGREGDSSGVKESSDDEFSDEEDESDEELSDEEDGCEIFEHWRSLDDNQTIGGLASITRWH